MKLIPPDEPLGSAWNRYCAEVNATAERYYRNNVLPFLHKRQWEFTAGMGTWSCRDCEGNQVADWDRPDDKEWQEIVSILQTDITGEGGNDLGSLMPDYTPPECA